MKWFAIDRCGEHDPHPAKDPLWPAGHLAHKGGEDSWHPLGKVMASTVPQLKPLPLVGRGWGGDFLPFAIALPQAERGGRQPYEEHRHTKRRKHFRHLLLLLLLLLLLPLAACDDMTHQPRYESYEKSGLFADRKALQAPPEGVIAQDDLASAAALADRPAMSLALIERGRERFQIYCTPCHDASGYGQGTIPARGFPQPPSFHIDRLRKASSRYFVDVMTRGHGVMYSFADRVEPADRWAIAAYIRALQLSQHAPVTALTDEDRRKLRESGS